MKPGLSIIPGPPQAQSTANQTIRRLLGQSTAREGVFHLGRSLLAFLIAIISAGLASLAIAAPILES
ncbi:MAG: hypothetical protein ACE5MM_02355, partial [Nitrospiraceae bacterium]